MAASIDSSARSCTKCFRPRPGCSPSPHLAIEAEGEAREVAGERVSPGAPQRGHAPVLSGAVVEQRLAAMHDEVAHGRPLAHHPHEIAQLLV